MSKAVIEDAQLGKVRKVKTSDYPIVRINEVLPFRVRFTTIGIESYSQNNGAPIGIAIIGYNNYIM